MGVWQPPYIAWAQAPRFPKLSCMRGRWFTFMHWYDEVSLFWCCLPRYIYFFIVAAWLSDHQHRKASMAIFLQHQCCSTMWCQKAISFIFSCRGFTIGGIRSSFMLSVSTSALCRRVQFAAIATIDDLRLSQEGFLFNLSWAPMPFYSIFVFYCWRRFVCASHSCHCKSLLNWRDLNSIICRHNDIIQLHDFNTSESWHLSQ